MPATTTCRHDTMRLFEMREVFAQELVVLYVVTLGAAELELLAGMEDRPPPLQIVGRAEVESVVQSANAEAGHLWFPGGSPHNYDRVVEMNRRHWRARSDDNPLVDVSDVEDSELPYYRDPMDRLRRMHQSSREMTTGITYQSPWRDPSSFL